MKFVTDIKEKEYDTFVSNNEKSHFLQSYTWGQFTYESRGLIPHYVGLKDNKDKLVATALLLQRKLPLGYSYFYSPRGFVLDYTKKDIILKFTKEIKKYVKEHKGIYFKIDPDIKLHDIDKDAKPLPGDNNYELVNYLKKIGYKRKKLTYFFETEQPRYTFRIDLKDKSEADVIANYSKTARRFMKKAENYEIEVKEGTKEQIEDFSNLMLETEKRQKFYSHDQDYYEKFYKHFSKGNHVKLMIAEVDIDKTISKLENNPNTKEEELEFFKEKKETAPNKVIVSSYVTVYYGNKAWYLYGANDMDYKMTYANYKLFNYQILSAVEQKKEIFDEFGTVGKPNSKKRGASLHEFKKKFGGEYTEFIGEFDYVIMPFTYFAFTTAISIRRKILKIINRIKVK